MISRFRRSNADLFIELEGGPHRLGNAIKGHVTLLPGEKFEMRGGQLELICNETYWTLVRRTTRTGSAETNEIASTVIREYSQPIYGETRIANLMPEVGNFEFNMPLNAPPTVRGQLASIEWRLKAILDVARGRDISREIDLVVLTAPDAGPSSPMPSGHASSSGSQLSERNLLLSVDSLRVSMGGTVEGVIKITPKEGLNSAAAPVDSIRIELMRSEKSGTRVFDLGVGLLEFREPEAIAGPITAGSPLEIQYSLTIPECLLATIAVHETAVTWRVRATVCLGNGEELEISQGVTVRGSD